MLLISIAGVVMSNEFKIVGIPLLSCLICIILKIASRNKKYKNKNWNDWAVGLDLMLTAIILMITRSVDHFVELNQGDIDNLYRQRLTEQFMVSIWILFGLMVALIIVTNTISSIGGRTRARCMRYGVFFFPILLD